jgi:hypothetical protein
MTSAIEQLLSLLLSFRFNCCATYIQYHQTMTNSCTTKKDIPDVGMCYGLRLSLYLCSYRSLNFFSLLSLLISFMIYILYFPSLCLCTLDLLFFFIHVYIYISFLFLLSSYLHHVILVVVLQFKLFGYHQY